MKNITRLYFIIISVIGFVVISSLVLPLCAQAQDQQPAMSQGMRWNNFLYRQQYAFGSGNNASIDSLLRKAVRLSNNQEADSARMLLIHTMNLSELWYYPKGVAESQAHLGYIFLIKNDLEQSKANFYKAASFLQQSGIRPGMLANIYNALATVYVRQGIRDSGLVYYYHSLDVIEQMPEKDSLLMATVYMNIVGGVLSGYAGYSGNKEQVMYYLDLAKSLAAGIGERGTLILGNIHVNDGLVDDRIDDDSASALASYRSGINLLRSVGAKADMQLAYALVASLYVDRKSYDAAKPYIDSAIAVNEAGFASSLQLNMILAGYLLHKNEYNRSLFYYNRAMDICNASGSANFKLTLYYFRAQVYHKMGEGLKAYEDQKRHSDLLDSLMNKQRIETVNAMETRYRTAEKDKKLLQGKLQLREQEAKIKEKNIWLGGILISVFFALTIIISRQRNKQKLLIQQQEIALLSSRMQGEDLERSRIARELHDGVSVLLSAAKMNYSAMGKENPQLAQTEPFREVGALLSQTVQEVRSISHNLVPGLLMHQSLPAAAQAFCELIRKGYNLHVELLAYGSFTRMDIEWNYAVYRMIQELVHNVIKHAQATEVLIQLTLHDDKLHLTVEDNGIGFIAGKSIMGLGLQSLRERVEKMQGQLLFSSKPSEGTTVEIEIPVPVS